MSKYSLAVYEVYSVGPDKEATELIAYDTYEANNIGEAYAQAAEKYGGHDRLIELKKEKKHEH